MHAGIHNFELHAFRAAFQMVPNYNFVLLYDVCKLTSFFNPHLAFHIEIKQKM